jgi:hypothetical protein
MDNRTVRSLRARSRNGLPWRVGLTVVATLNLAAALHQGPAAGTYTDLTLWSLASRLRDPLFGGSNGPAIDRSFRIARKFVAARPGPGMQS